MAKFGALQVSDEFETLVFETLDHAMESVSSGEVLIPMAFVVAQDGSKTIFRMPLEDMAAVEKALTRVLSDPAKPVRAYAFATDRLLHLEGGKKQDAIYLEAAEAGAAHGVTFIQKYQKAEPGKSFGVLGSPALFDQRPGDRFTRLDGGKKMQGGFGADGAFSQEEWHTLRVSPVFVFMVVAVSDGSLDKKEAIAFEKVLRAATSFQSKLMRQVLAEVIDEVPALIARVFEQKLDFMASLGKVADIVEAKLSAEDARLFKIALLQIGKNIAEASGGFFGFGNKISKQEEAALAATYVALRLAG